MRRETAPGKYLISDIRLRFVWNGRELVVEIFSGLAAVIGYLVPEILLWTSGGKSSHSISVIIIVVVVVIFASGQFACARVATHGGVCMLSWSLRRRGRGERAAVRACVLQLLKWVEEVWPASE